MLTQGPPPYPKCKCNISSFLTFPHLSDYLIGAMEIMIVVVLLEMMWGWESWQGGSFMLKVCMGEQGLGTVFLYFLFYFYGVNCFFMTGA